MSDQNSKQTHFDQSKKNFSSDESWVIGIDLGTTYSLAALVNEGSVELIENEQISTFLPSVVACVGEKVLVGWEAMAAKNNQPDEYFYSFKRFMGSSFDAVKPAAHLSYSVQRGERNQVLLGSAPHQYRPETLCAFVLKKIKENCERILGHAIAKVIITVPAYFDDQQRQATRDAAVIAGLEPVRILNEPTAAAISYGLDNRENQHIMVYDLGGGTFDITLLKIQAKMFRVLATYGDTNLGGDDFDNAIVKHALQQFPQLEPEFHADKNAFKKIAERAKIDLSSQLETTIVWSKKQNIQALFTREELDQLLSPWVDATIESMDQVLKEANITREQLDEVVLVGGSTRLPLIRHKVAQFFGRPPFIKIDPDKVVAYGAAIQANILQHGKRDYVLLDVIPLSLGIETIGGVFAKLIVKNSSLPAKVKETFSTSVDNQTSVDINIYQGEREFVKDCRLLGRFRLKNLPKMPAGLARIEVEFLVNTNGILQVSAVETRSNIQAQIDIIPDHGLTNAEVLAKIEDSVIHAEEDMLARSHSELVAKAQSLLVSVQRNKIDWAEILRLEEQQEIEQICSQLEQQLADKDYVNVQQSVALLGEATRDFADRIFSTAIKKQLTQSNLSQKD